MVDCCIKSFVDCCNIPIMGIHVMVGWEESVDLKLILNQLRWLTTHDALPPLEALQHWDLSWCRRANQMEWEIDFNGKRWSAVRIGGRTMVTAGCKVRCDDGTRHDDATSNDTADDDGGRTLESMQQPTKLHEKVGRRGSKMIMWWWWRMNIIGAVDGAMSSSSCSAKSGINERSTWCIAHLIFDSHNSPKKWTSVLIQVCLPTK